MKKTIIQILSASLVGAFVAISVPAAAAQASSETLLSSGVNVDQHYDVSHKRKYRNHERDGNRERHGFHKKRDRQFLGRQICSPRDAVHKAQRLGLRHAEINRVNKRLVVVSGRSRGHRLVVGMERHSRHCQIAFVRDIPRHGLKRGYRY